MATKSICKTVRLKDSRLIKGLVSALENSQGKKSKEVFIDRLVEEIKGEDIKKYFGVDNDGI